MIGTQLFVAHNSPSPGHYPWFYTRNQLQVLLPKYNRKTETLNYVVSASYVPRCSCCTKPLRYQGVAAFIGFCASAVSDTLSNSIRVLKTTKQTSEQAITYVQAFNQVVAKDGISGLMFRGLQTKIISNGFQGLLFNVLWQVIQDAMKENEKKSK